MEIIASDVSLKSSSKSVSWEKEEESLIAWKGGEAERKLAYEEPVEVNLSPEARKALEERMQTSDGANPESTVRAVNEAFDEYLQGSVQNLIPKSGVQSPEESQDDSPYDLSLMDRLKLRLIEELAFKFTDKKIKVKLQSEEEAAVQKVLTAGMQADFSGRLQSVLNGGNPQSVGWGLDYSYTHTEYEKETVSFSASGAVKTADGREISLNVALKMSRESLSTESLSIKAGDALIDPLVINFGAEAAELSDATVKFDLKVGGSDEEIAVLKDGSAFLALDKDGNGRIDDGSELFGPKSGDGFSELSAYDDDGNGWIDEKDAVFNRLQVWRVDGDGMEWKSSLKSVGIGAIYLGSASTKFTLTGDADPSQTHGVLRETGVYLKENGGVGTIQELDLAAKAS